MKTHSTHAAACDTTKHERCAAAKLLETKGRRTIGEYRRQIGALTTHCRKHEREDLQQLAHVFQRLGFLITRRPLDADRVAALVMIENIVHGMWDSHCGERDRQRLVFYVEELYLFARRPPGATWEPGAFYPSRTHGHAVGGAVTPSNVIDLAARRAEIEASS